MPVSAIAQDRPVVFLHGLGAEAADWANTAGRLQQQLAIDARLPELPWQQIYEQQALALAGSAALSPGNGLPLAVGHSNGGVVARELSRVRPLDGIATIGTPHRGAPVVPGFGQWLTFQAAAPGLLNYVVQSFGAWSDWSWTFASVQGALSWISDFSIWSVVYLAGALGVQTAVPVMGEMQPGSSYLNSLNSSSNLQREAAAVPSRVGVVSVAHNFYWAGPARAIAPAHADEIAAALYATAYALVYWSGYIAAEADPTDVVAFRQWASLSTVASFLFEVDPFYCSLVSGTPVGQCVPNDGVVPLTSQEYPGAPNIYVGLDNDGPAHSEEKDWGESVLYDALVWYLHLTPRVSLPAPSPSPGPGPSNPPPGTPGSGGAPPAGSDPGLLVADEALWPGDSLRSADGRFLLVYQTDGNLVLYDDQGVPIWASDTGGTSTGVAVMQSDGNFVIYDASNVPIWASGDSYGHPGAYLILQSDGNLVIYDVDGSPLWATGTWR